MADPPAKPTAPSPGLAKVRRVATAARRTLELVGLREGWFSTMVDEADIISEGAVQVVHGVEGYFGSTSLRCRLFRSGETSHDVAALARLVVSDPNARLRLLRLAHREAVTRAGSRRLGVLSAEISAQPADDDASVLAIGIDVSAALLDAATADVADGGAHNRA